MKAQWILAVDCETNDKPRDFRGADDDLDCWPRLVQIGMVMANASDGRIVCQSEGLIRSRGEWGIARGAQAVHGITTEDCDRFGSPIEHCIAAFAWLARKADIVVAHNMAFDWPVLLCESIRVGDPLPEDPGKRACTMQLGTEVCRIPSASGNAGYKWPRMNELHQHLFGEGFDGAHSALADASACLRCYLEMRRQGLA